jgi:hypothetical protein
VVDDEIFLIAEFIRWLQEQALPNFRRLKSARLGDGI